MSVVSSRTPELQVACLAIPSCRISCSTEDRSRFSLMRLTRISKRLLSSRYTSVNAFRRCASVPVTIAGSAKPQWAVIGRPGHTGHVSSAALSQTVMTRSIVGASSASNSAQSLEHKCSTAWPWERSSSSAWVFTSPAGWLPALYAFKYPRPRRFKRHSAIWLRAELPVQRKSTLKDPFATVRLRSMLELNKLKVD